MVSIEPVIKAEYSPEERAVIAGYLISKRVGTLQALDSVGSIKSGTTEGWAEGTYRYYLVAEQYSRFLLYWVGYEVAKDQNWPTTP